MLNSPHILMVAGDPSGDRHAARLAEHLKSKIPTMTLTALGGPHLRAVAHSFLYSLVELGGFGFWEPLLKMAQLRQALKQVDQVLDQNRPDLVIPVDYYGFNIHVARKARSRGIPVAYYISPQVWASRPHRIQALAKAVTRMLVIFPFEVPLYEKSSVPVRFVGHPLLESVPAPRPDTPSAQTIGLLPGSRWGTVKRHLPILVETARRLHDRFPDARFTLFRPREISPERYEPYLSHFNGIQLVEDADYKGRRDLTLALSVSGTAALENMLLGIPMIIMYRLSWLTYWIARQLIRIPYVGIPNILADKSVVPELLQMNCTADALVRTASELLEHPDRLQAMRETLLSLRASLQEGGSSHAAEAVIEVLNETCGVPA